MPSRHMGLDREMTDLPKDVTGTHGYKSRLASLNSRGSAKMAGVKDEDIARREKNGK